MQMTAKTERDLVIRFRDAKQRKSEAEAVLDKANQELLAAESDLVELLQTQDKKSTARYESIGFCTLKKPQLYARFDKEDEEKVFTFLLAEGRNDMLRTTVHPSSLSSYVKKRVEEGKGVPEFLKYYLKSTVLFTADK